MTNTAGGGPRTNQGKEVARWNAARHGIRSSAPVVPGIEKPEDWERHLAGTLGSLSPEGHLETVLAERVALLSWRLHRVTRFEREAIALAQERVEEDLAQVRLFSSDPGPSDPQAVRSNLKAARARHRLLKRFPKLPDDERLSGFDAGSILWDVTEYTDQVAERKVDPDDVLEAISIPGVPEGVDWEDYEGWTAGKVRAGIEAIAKATGEDPKELLECATDRARRDVTDREQDLERVKQDLERMSRERLLPDDKTLEKVARYEAHLCR
ncbi:MAG TPA: hypothetical protein VE225_05730, partial [Rubrobacteraceae bacterium]|nr:hypothetical protein [Rubrobacteraceae bacterium]